MDMCGFACSPYHRGCKGVKTPNKEIIMLSKGMTPKNEKVRWNIGGMPLFCYLIERIM